MDTSAVSAISFASFMIANTASTVPRVAPRNRSQLGCRIRSVAAEAAVLQGGGGMHVTLLKRAHESAAVMLPLR